MLGFIVLSRGTRIPLGFVIYEEEDEFNKVTAVMANSDIAMAQLGILHCFGSRWLISFASITGKNLFRVDNNCSLAIRF